MQKFIIWKAFKWSRELYLKIFEFTVVDLWLHWDVQKVNVNAR